MTQRSTAVGIREAQHAFIVQQGAGFHFNEDLAVLGIARAHGLSDSTSLSACFVKSYPANERRIADALGIHPKVIWPSRYYPNGEPKPRGFRAIQFNAHQRVVNGNCALGV